MTTSTSQNTHETDTANNASYTTISTILTLAIPTFGQLIAEPAFVLIDTAIVGHIGGQALAGLSVGSTIVLTVVGLCVFLAYSTTTQVGRLLGAGKRGEGLEAGIDGLWLAGIIGVVVSVALFVIARPLCTAMGAQGSVLHNAVDYVRAVVFGIPGMLLVYAANGIFRGLQKVRITLIAAMVGAILNTLLDLLFILGFGWGVFGSGVATLISQWFMAVALISFGVVDSCGRCPFAAAFVRSVEQCWRWCGVVFAYACVACMPGGECGAGHAYGCGSVGCISGGEFQLEFCAEHA